MPLDIETRGALEQMIDTAIKEIPFMVKLYRTPKLKNHMMLKEENDFVFGYVWGSVTARISSYLTATRMRLPRDDELDEVMDVMDRRAADIRKAIFDAG